MWMGEGRGQWGQLLPEWSWHKGASADLCCRVQRGKQSWGCSKEGQEAEVLRGV